MSHLHDPASSNWSEVRPVRRARQWTGGVEGNARLTALAGLLLLALLFIEGITILRIHALLQVHLFVGLLLVPPLLLKLASTGYRFVRYYTGNRSYRAAGPPGPLLRMIAPLLVASTVGLLVTGIVLLIVGPAGGEVWRRLHTLFFLVWFWLMAVHVLAYLRRAPWLALADLRAGAGRGIRSLSAGSLTRQGLVVGSLLLGVALAVAATPLDASWIHLFSRLAPVN